MILRTRHLPPRSVRRPEPALGYIVAMLLAGGGAFALMTFGALVWGWSLTPLTWYIARSSGLVLYLVTWFNLVTGMGITTKLLNKIGGNGSTFSLHGYAFHLWYGFLFLHMMSLALDPTVNFGAKQLTVPFASSLREPWTGFGILAAEITMVIGASFSIRQFIGYRAWRALHWLSFPIFLMGIAHGIGAGTDSGNLGVQLMYLMTGSSVLCMVIFRMLGRNPKKSPMPVRVQGEPAFDRFADLSKSTPSRVP